MQPAKNKGKGDGDGDNAAPHNEQVGDATQFATSQDEAVDENVVEDVADPGAGVLRAVATLKKCLPTAFPVNGRWRAL